MACSLRSAASRWSAACLSFSSRRMASAVATASSKCARAGLQSPGRPIVPAECVGQPGRRWAGLRPRRRRQRASLPARRGERRRSPARCRGRRARRRARPAGGPMRGPGGGADVPGGVHPVAPGQRTKPVGPAPATDTTGRGVASAPAASGSRPGSGGVSPRATASSSRITTADGTSSWSSGTSTDARWRQPGRRPRRRQRGTPRCRRRRRRPSRRGVPTRRAAPPPRARPRYRRRRPGRRRRRTGRAATTGRPPARGAHRRARAAEGALSVGLCGDRLAALLERGVMLGDPRRLDRQRRAVPHDLVAAGVESGVPRVDERGRPLVAERVDRERHRLGVVGRDHRSVRRGPLRHPGV